MLRVDDTCGLHVLHRLGAAADVPRVLFDGPSLALFFILVFDQVGHLGSGLHHQLRIQVILF